MRQHPIPPVSEPQQYRAIGLVRGVFVPQDSDLPTRGRLLTSDGADLEAVVMGRLLTLMRRHLDISQPHLWVVYPRSRDDHSLHLQLMGVWEPSTLSKGEEAGEPTPDDTLPEGDDYFSLRGELIYTRPESGDVVLKVRQQPRADGTRPTPFKLHLSGTIPMDHLRHFVSIDARRQGQLLALRRAHPALRLGSFEPLVAEGEVLVLRRRHADAGHTDDLLLAFNLGLTDASVPLPVAAPAGPPLFSHAGAAIDGQTLRLPAGGVLYARLP
jgi:hypothetical protein